MKTEMKCPNWPWISLIVCVSLFLLFFIWGGSIQSEIDALNHEAERMQSVDYLAVTAVESFFRGFFGDPFGKANEEAQKQEGMTNTYYRLNSQLGMVSTGTGLFYLLSLASGGFWFWAHKKIVERGNARAGINSPSRAQFHGPVVSDRWILEGVDAENGAKVGLKLPETTTPQAEVTLGRNRKSCDLAIPNTSVSSRHATFVRSVDGWNIQDVGSSNGTFLNGKRLSPFELHPLSNGVSVSIGEVVLTVTRVS